MTTHGPGHLKGFDYVGPYRYFLTLCTASRQPLFTHQDIVTLVLSQIRHAAAREQFALAAYCFMPDHLHVLAEGLTAQSDALRFIKGAKQRAGFHFRGRFGSRLWQRYSYERVLRPDADLLGVAKYILENPVRAGLVAHPSGYEFLGSDVYQVDEILEAVAMSPFAV